MNFTFPKPTKQLAALGRIAQHFGSPERGILFLATILAIAATAYSYVHGYIIAYGDAESHLNIAKRVVDSLTPGFAQLGGIWLPLPHILMLPFVYFDPLWRSGIAGSIVSGTAYIISSVYLYKTAYVLTASKKISFFSALVFMTNLSILYLQSTPMTELTLIVFFVLSSYYFILFLNRPNNFRYLIVAALFTFCATLSRYDGWFMALTQCGVLVLFFSPYQFNSKALRSLMRFRKPPHPLFRKDPTTPESTSSNWQRLEGTVLLFATLAFFGIALWLLWDLLILKDALYFTHSQFSATSQQQGWLAKGQLPAYHDMIQSIGYYTITAMNNIGIFAFLLTIAGIVSFFRSTVRYKYLITIVLFVPYFFYVITLFLGQSIIFIPHITPPNFEWTLFNVRYGAMMVPAASLYIGFLLSRVSLSQKTLVILLLVGQFGLYGIGYAHVLTLQDGIAGLSTAKRPDAEVWMHDHYDHGLVLLDDYSRLISIIRSNIPMQNVIYIGNKPYWEESLREPEKYATWIIVQRNDDIWKSIYEPPEMQGRLYKYFTKEYTSPEILIFKKTSEL